MKKEKTYKIKGKNLPFEWRLLLSEAKNNNITLRNAIFSPFLYYIYKYKEHEVYLVDYIIVASNPIITALILAKYIRENKNKSLKKVALVFDSGADYWAYHVYQDNYKDIYSLLEESWGNVEVIAVNIENKFEVARVKTEKHIKKRVAVHITKTHQYKKESGYQRKLTKNVALQNRVRVKLTEELIRTISKNNNFIKDEFTENPKYSFASELHSHILVTNNLSLTAVPNGWCNTYPDENCANETKFNYDNEMLIANENKMKLTYGTAIKVGKSFVDLESFSKQEVNELREEIRG